MSTRALARLLSRDRRLRETLEEVLAAAGDQAALLDVDGALLAGPPGAEGDESARSPVYWNGELAGWTVNAPQTAPLTRLVDWIASQEEEKKALGAEMIERYRELNLLYTLAERLAESPQAETIVQAALDEALRLNKAASALYLEASDTLELRLAAAAGAPRALNGVGDLFRRVLLSGKADIDNQARAADYFNDAPEPTQALACAPLKTDRRRVGLIVLARDAGAPFTAGALKLLNSVAMQITPALEILRLYRVAVENERMERELLMARQVQESLLPGEMPALEGWEFARLWRPARKVSGDFYDLIDEAPGQVGMVIGDVTDKGMPASLFMVFARSALRASLDQVEAPARAVAAANHLICRDSFEGLFATLVYARLMTESGLLTYVNAGHNPPLHYSARKGACVPLARTGLPLGVIDPTRYEERSVALQPGDFVLFYTDGITEAVDFAQAEFGLERLIKVVEAHHGCSPAEILAGIEQAMDAFCDPEQAFDDITFLLVRRV